ncbi:aromatic ring-hydroxylating dioxygenase subunit alpha [Enterovirga aerilata]|uniref:Rieske 2Fe-2S domain-containing protein n=1 Tax=Enterovirga aerilata TaxID=2730920 RepID=A0A849I949_9HYPH|nr:aromatic ring-hydroxylating dioxygenase subunit alpha [Enterovirga sp. DB1703]NNM72815.1 Rieske 2Fe-2S domain-containing protein [Enterovirga sp. DB1703]
MSFLRNTWYVALWSQDLEAGKLVSRTFLNEPIVMFRREDGSPAAIADACAHRFAPLSMGKIVHGDRVRCPYHALEFDGSGACVHNPHGNGRIPPAMKVRSYPLHEKHSLIWIWMGDKEADPALIPDFRLLDPDSGRLVSKRDWILMEASWELITDNLLDLSHTAVVHEGILGSEHTIKANLTIEQKGTTVFVGRSVPNVPAPGLYDLLYKRDGGQVDLWADMRWDVPGCMINDTGVTEPGAPRAEGTGFFGMHFLTPETEKTTYYLFAAVRQNPRSWGEPLDTEIQRQVSDLRRIAFQEQDQGIIRAQQNVMHTAPYPLKYCLLEIDVGPVRYKRIMDGLVRQEQEELQAGTGRAA